jgi:hypothetical protein
MARNTRAIRLYERMGFPVEGRRPECLLVGGQFIDKLTMATLLPGPPAAPLSLARPPAGRRPARGPLMKTVKGSRHPFVYVFLMAAQ